MACINILSTMFNKSPSRIWTEITFFNTQSTILLGVFTVVSQTQFTNNNQDLKYRIDTLNVEGD